MKDIFLPLELDKDYNYNYLIALYNLTEYNSNSKRNDIVTFDNIQQLERKINNLDCGNITIVSYSTLRRLLKKESYQQFYTYYESDGKIIIYNDFRKTAQRTQNRFVIITAKESSILLNHNDKLLTYYYILQKVKCGSAKEKKHNSTICQMLQELGYSQNSSYVSRISEYNRILTDNKLLSIEKYRDQNGNERNSYRLV